MNILVIVAGVIIVISIGAIVKKSSKEFSLLLSVVAVALILVLILKDMLPIVDEMSNLLNGGIIESFYIEILIKAIGITIIGQVTVSLCKDAGETALGNVVELASKVAILLLSMPIIRNILSYLGEILKN